MGMILAEMMLVYHGFCQFPYAIPLCFHIVAGSKIS